MYAVTKTLSWSMGHALSRGYRGKCNDFHGHNWTAAITVKSGNLNSVAMVIDFGDFTPVKTWIDEHLDHVTLVCRDHPIVPMLLGYTTAQSPFWPNVDEEQLMPILFYITLFGFRIVPWNPTSENVAKLLHEVTCTLLNLPENCVGVTVSENVTSEAAYA